MFIIFEDVDANIPLIKMVRWYSKKMDEMVGGRWENDL